MSSYIERGTIFKGLDGQLYCETDLVRGIKKPLNVSDINYAFSPVDCLCTKPDGQVVNMIDMLYDMGLTINQIPDTFDKHSSLNDRLSADQQRIYATINAKDYLSYRGESISIPHSKLGYTKDLKIEGKTYHNIANYDCIFANTSKEDGNIFKLNYGGDENSASIVPRNNNLYKPNTEYVVIVDILENTTGGKRLGISSAWADIVVGDRPSFPNALGINSLTFRTKNVLSESTQGMMYFCCWDRGPQDLSKYIKFKYMIIEKSQLPTNIDELGYFEGIESTCERETNLCEFMEIGGVNYNGGSDYEGNEYCRTSYIPVRKGKTYSVSKHNISNADENFNIYYYDVNKKWISELNSLPTEKFTFTAKATGYVRLEHRALKGTLNPTEISNVKRQVNEGEYVLPYTKPFKTSVKYESTTTNFAESFTQSVTLNAGEFTGYKRVNVPLKGELYQGLVKDGSFIAGGGSVVVHFYDENKNRIEWLTIHGTPRKFDWKNIIEKATYYRITHNESTSITFDDFFIGKEPIYSKGQVNKRGILLPFIDGLKGLSDVKDTVEARADGIYAIQRVGKIVLSGSSSEGWGTYREENNGYVCFRYGKLFSKNNNSQKAICDKFTRGDLRDLNTSPKEAFSFYTDNNIEGYYIYIYMKKDTLGILPTDDINAMHTKWREWLSKNPITFYVELGTSITHKISDVSILDLKTYLEMTHIFSECAMKPTIHCKVATTTQAVLTDINSNNQQIQLNNDVYREKIATQDEEVQKIQEEQILQNEIDSVIQASQDEIRTMLTL